MRFIAGIGDALPWMLIVFVAAAGLSLVLTPTVRRLVMRHGMIDRPEARRVNVVPVPRARRISALLRDVTGSTFNTCASRCWASSRCSTTTACP